MSAVLSARQTGRAILLFAAVVLTALWSVPSQARKIAIDFGDSYFNSGQNFGFETVGSTLTDGTAACSDNLSLLPQSCFLALTLDASSSALELGFNVNFGTGNKHTLFVNENGALSFDAPLPATLSTTLAAIGSPVIAPFYADMESGQYFDAANLVFDGSHTEAIVYGRGEADPVADSTGAYNPLEAVKAFHVSWAGTFLRGTDPPVFIYTQVVLYAHPSSADGDFDLRIRYGINDTDSYSVPPGIPGFVLDANTAALSSPLQAGTDYFYSFRGGKLQGATPPDADGDGIPDSTDNCPAIANPTQANSDGDSFGDACDNCPKVSNPDQKDTNGNGIGDACEVAAVKRCYVDSDNDIDAYDIVAILKATGKHVGATDPRDADGNLIVSFGDAAKCASLCTRRYCATK
ncbi:MAG: thrombospondin type 3 repeat-containing protein [Steroidobacteraceae bacterium]